MRRIACAVVLSFLFVRRALADVGPPVDVRWSGDWPEPARPGVETVGRFEIEAHRLSLRRFSPDRSPE